MSYRQLFWLGLCLIAGPVFAAPDGEALYRLHCSACHHDGGEGGIGLPLVAEKLSHESDAYLHDTIRYGRPGRIMPSFQTLSDAQVDAIVGYLRVLTGTGEVVFPRTEVAGDPVRGQVLYAQHCQRCHGADGSGEGKGTGVTLSRERSFMVMPASIANPGFLASAPDEMIRHQIRTGRRLSGMPPFTEQELDDQQINDVVRYVRSLGTTQRHAEPLADDQRPTHVVESPYDFDTTVANIKAALTGSNFRIFPERFVEEGLTDEFSVNKRQVGVRFCNFNALYGMLAIEPRLGAVLPCRITVLERDDGSVLLVVPNLRVVARWFNNDELVELWDRMEQTFASIIEEVTL